MKKEYSKPTVEEITLHLESDSLAQTFSKLEVDVDNAADPENEENPEVGD